MGLTSSGRFSHRKSPLTTLMKVITFLGSEFGFIAILVVRVLERR
jgi:hypothetical protein